MGLGHKMKDTKVRVSRGVLCIHAAAMSHFTDGTSRAVCMNSQRWQ